MKTAILYYSSSTGHTKLLVDAIVTKFGVDAINLRDGEPQIDLSSYDLIGIASGVYYGSFHPSLLQFISTRMPQYKKVFLIFTSGSTLLKHYYCKTAFNALFACHSVIMGRYSCPGHCTYGLLKVFGGISKGRPNEQDIREAVDFYSGIQQAILSSANFPTD